MAKTVLIRANAPRPEFAEDERPLLEYFKSRESDELVIGLVGPIGSGVSSSAKTIKQILEKDFGYEATVVKVSDKIKTLANISSMPEEGPERFEILQQAGTELRKKHGASYLMEYCIQEIGGDRRFEKAEGELNPTSQRTAHVIDGIKNPAEMELLRAVYREHFWSVAVVADENRRKERLKFRGFDSDQEAEAVLRRDADEVIGHGQKVRASAHKADYFIHNDTTSFDDLKGKIRHLLDRIFNTDIGSLSQDETGMALATAAASRSACLSRQVGAAILSQDGEALGIGWNDVPKFGGGLYGDLTPYPPNKPDHRCARLDAQECHNDSNKTKLYEQIYSALSSKGLVDAKASAASVLLALQETDIRNIIEYSRSIHAEMEAILSAGRKGRSVVGAKLYTTTYPCHNCARHIVAAGISEVVYIEPYPKSLAISLHGDAIVEGTGTDRKVLFRQYEGIAPRSTNRVYRIGEERKRDGKWARNDASTATPVFRPALDSFVEREQLVIAKLENREDGDGKASPPS